MIATGLAPDGAWIDLGSVDIPAGHPHFWTMRGSVRVAQICADRDLRWAAIPNIISMSRSPCSHTLPQRPREDYAIVPIGFGRRSALTKRAV